MIEFDIVQTSSTASHNGEMIRKLRYLQHFSYTENWTKKRLQKVQQIVEKRKNTDSFKIFETIGPKDLSPHDLLKRVAIFYMSNHFVQSIRA